MLEKLPADPRGSFGCPVCGKSLTAGKAKKGFLTWCNHPGCHSYKVFHQDYDTITCDHEVKKTKQGPGWINTHCPACKYSAFFYTVKKAEKAPVKGTTR